MATGTFDVYIKDGNGFLRRWLAKAIYLFDRKKAVEFYSKKLTIKFGENGRWQKFVK